MKKSIALRLVALLIVSVFFLTSCVFGAIISFDWEVESHSQFIEKIEKFNRTHDEFVNTFISFDLDENENVSKSIYHFVTVANKSVVQRLGLCDKVCRTFDVYIMYYLRSDIEDTEHSDHAYQIGCYYRDKPFNFSEQDKIEIKKCKTYDGNEPSERCSYEYIDFIYSEILYSNKFLYNNIYHYEMFVNDTKCACIHISSFDEESEEKLNEILQMLLDSMVVLNTEE